MEHIKCASEMNGAAGLKQRPGEKKEKKRKTCATLNFGKSTSRDLSPRVKKRKRREPERCATGTFIAKTRRGAQCSNGHARIDFPGGVPPSLRRSTVRAYRSRRVSSPPRVPDFSRLATPRRLRRSVYRYFAPIDIVAITR